MGYILKGFFIGIFFLVAFTLILVPMAQTLINDVSKIKCDYSCSAEKLLNSYQNPMTIILFLAFWILGSKISELSALANERERLPVYLKKKESKEFKWPWEHKLEVVEDKEK